MVRWLGAITRKATSKTYKSGFRAYTRFTQMTATQLIDEAIADRRKDVRERKDVVKTRIIHFYKWLTTEAPVMSRGKGVRRQIGKGKSDKVAHTYVGAVRSFYSTYDITVRLKGRYKLPRPRVRNKRMIVANDQVATLLKHARYLRDRAIILTLYQSGMDVSTLCSLTFGDVADKLDEHPLKLELFRQKSSTEYYSFLGRDAVDAIKVYLNMVAERGVPLSRDTSLFLKLSRKAMTCEGITPNLVQNMMKQVAMRSGLVDKTMNGKAINPLSPHALRESFGSIMINAGVPDTIVDFWLGHRIGDMDKAYKGVQYDSLKAMYLQREKLLSVTKKSMDIEAIKHDVRQEIETQSQQLQTLVNGLSSENSRLQRELHGFEEKLAKLNARVEQWEAFTKRFMGATNDQLTAIGQAVFEQEEKNLTTQEQADRA